jgi:hypothetical protein
MYSISVFLFAEDISLLFIQFAVRPMLLLGLWRRLADLQIESPIEFVIGQRGIDTLNLFLLVV